MASDLSFVEYVREQMAAAGVVSFRRMFGEYAVYCDGKVVALVCDNRLYVKLTAAGRAVLDQVKEGFPYPGARSWIVADDCLDDDALLTRLIRATVQALPMPAPKAPKTTKRITTRPARR